MKNRLSFLTLIKSLATVSFFLSNNVFSEVTSNNCQYRDALEFLDCHDVTYELKTGAELYSQGIKSGDQFIIHATTENDYIELYTHPELKNIWMKVTIDNQTINTPIQDLYTYSVQENGKTLNFAPSIKVYLGEGDDEFDAANIRYNSRVNKSLYVEVYGEDGSNVIRGSAGNDILHGGASDDYIYGIAGNDTIYGNGKKDAIYGGAGNDILHGGQGNDIIQGGKGIDCIDDEEGNNSIKI